MKTFLLTFFFLWLLLRKYRKSNNVTAPTLPRGWHWLRGCEGKPEIACVEQKSHNCGICRTACGVWWSGFLLFLRVHKNTRWIVVEFNLGVWYCLDTLKPNVGSTLRAKVLTICFISVEWLSNISSSPWTSSKAFKKTGFSVTAVTFVKQSWATGGHHVCANLPHYGCW